MLKFLCGESVLLSRPDQSQVISNRKTAGVTVLFTLQLSQVTTAVDLLTRLIHM